MYTPTPRTPESVAAVDKFFSVPASMPPTEKTFALLIAKAFSDGMAAQRLLSAPSQPET